MSKSGSKEVGRKKLKPTIHQYCEDKSKYFDHHRKIEEAFQRDCEEFLQEYEKQKDLSLQAFIRVWEKRDFDSIFSCPDLIEELPYLADSYFFIILKFLIHGPNDYIKVGALYLLHAMYVQQHRKHIIKIKMTSSEFTQLEQLTERMYKDGVVDCVFVLTTLTTADAFHFVVQVRDYGLEPKFAWRQLELKNDIFLKQTDPLKKIVSPLLESDQDIKSLANICQEYDKLLKKFEEQTGKVIRVQPECTIVQDAIAERQKLKDIVSTLDDVTYPESDSNNEDEVTH